MDQAVGSAVPDILLGRAGVSKVSNSFLLGQEH